MNVGAKRYDPIAASARALAAGDPIRALNGISLRDDPPALALRGIAMAQLGEYPRACELLRQAARGFGPHEALARARCVVAEAEVALAMREIGGSQRELAAAAAALEAHGDLQNVLQARLIAARRLLLLGLLDEAEGALSRFDEGPTALAHPAASGASRPRELPPSLAAIAALVAAELSLRRLRIGAAREALARARQAADRARIPAILAEVSEACATLEHPAARRIIGQHEQALRLDEVVDILESDALVVDGCRRRVGAGPTWLPLARRPVLFALARSLAEAWPGDVERQRLIASAFRIRRPDETHRARLRVEIGRLRSLVEPLARIEATGPGFALVPHDGRSVALLAPPVDGDRGSLLALLADGAAWSSASLALAMDASQRTVQRELTELEAAGQVRAIGRGRTRRWLAAPLAGFATILLLPVVLPPR